MAKGKKQKKSGEEVEGEEEGGGGGKKKIILMVVPALLAIGGGAFFFLGGSDDASAPTTTTIAPIEGEVITIETLTVNLVGEENRYARLGFAVVLDSLADAGAVESKLPLLQDAAIGVMVHYDSTTLQSVEGQEQLRQELTDASIALFPDGEVLRAVLTELIVQ
ncbi:MAG: flagellar basal body-associated protein FliL [Acidimicrobiia bacterium]